MIPLSELVPFQAFQKIPRWSRQIIVSEKIDGTHAVVYVSSDGRVIAGSRSRWIAPGKQDNHGFAAWVKEHESELRELGVGYHRGEWWGESINRGYGLKEKRWSLFNTSKWYDANSSFASTIKERQRIYITDTSKNTTQCPKCCTVVPIIYAGIMSEYAIHASLVSLDHEGSFASPGFKPAEGIVIYHTQGNLFFKKTLVNDEVGKSADGNA